MSIPPVRPVFQNGQRLTAERLSQAQEYLRQLVREIALAPLSAGVAGGFEIAPVLGDSATTLTVQPGMVIDGKGRVVISFVVQTVTVDELTTLVGGVWSLGEVVEIAVALDTNDVGQCGDTPPACIAEGARLLFRKVSLPSVPITAFDSAASPNRVEPWEDIDTVPPTDDDCRIVIGHAIRLFDGLSTTTFYRQGVAPRFGVIRNSEGAPSIYLKQLSFDFDGSGSAPAVTTPGMAITVATLFEKVVAFLAPVGGVNLQATHVAPFLALFSAGRFGGGPLLAAGLADRRVFEVSGGAGDFDAASGISEIPAGQAGVSAVTCALETSSGDIPGGTTAVLALGHDIAGGTVHVRRFPPGPILGLSAGPSYSAPDGSGARVVPVATSGILKAIVRLPANVPSLPAGSDLTPDGPALLAPAHDGDRVVARLAQDLSGAGTSIESFVWVVYPALTRGSPAGSFNRVQPILPSWISENGGSADWTFDDSALVFQQVFTNSTPAVAELIVPLSRLVRGSTLSGVRVRLKGSSAHLPTGGMPAARIKRVDTSGAVVDLSPLVSDSTATAADYAQAHDVVVDVTVDEPITESGSEYFVALFGEYGGSAAAGLALVNATAELSSEY